MFITDTNPETLVSDRRWSFFILNAFLWAVGAVLMAARITANGWTVGVFGLYLLFLLLQAQLVYGFTLAVTGWWILRCGGDPVRINRTVQPGEVCAGLPPAAIIMPIFNEDVGRVFKGLRAMYESLRATGQADAFHFYILSDSSDSNVWIAEERAWFELCKSVQGFGRIFYRKRRVSLHHKSGNVADFCRRWGSRYSYIIVVDADSVMSGGTFVRLMNLMEKNPQVGLIQTFTRLALGQTLFQRVNQFASQLYGPLFVAGANFWQLDSAGFYGHNAIIRVQPFMRFCAMPELPPSGPLGRRILSHDTVEAALMRQAGYEVWNDYDLSESYEESPPHLLASLQRDRRWCHGNLQHLWFLFARGLALPSRINILAGIMAYGGSPLWLLFLVASPLLFVGGAAPANNFLMFACAMFMLLLPKLLAAQRLISGPQFVQAPFTRLKILASVLVETIYSMIQAPILMLFYTEFVWSSFFGGMVGWGRQQRSDDQGPSWRQCVAVHWIHTLIALAALVLVARCVPALLPWLSLVLVGPLVAIPFTRITASSRLGQITRAHGWFLVREEAHLPEVLQPLTRPDETFAEDGQPGGDFPEDFGLAKAVLDPRLNALHVSLLRERSQTPAHVHERLTMLCDELLRHGPSALPPREKRMLLWDADAMLGLHQKLWNSPSSALHPWWRHAFEKYHDSICKTQGKGRGEELQIATDGHLDSMEITDISALNPSPMRPEPVARGSLITIPVNGSININ